LASASIRAAHASYTASAPITGQDPAWPAALAAASLPSLVAYNLSPWPTFLNQALACALWGGFVATGAASRSSRRSASLMVALALFFGAAAVTWLFGGLPASLALSALSTPWRLRRCS